MAYVAWLQALTSTARETLSKWFEESKPWFSGLKNQNDDTVEQGLLSG